MASLQEFQRYWDNLDPSDFTHNYSKHLEEEIDDPQQALENITEVLFGDETYIDDEKLWESIRCLSQHFGKKINEKCPDSGARVIRNETYKKTIEKKDKHHFELRGAVERHLIQVKTALYGNESIDEYCVNMAIKNLDYMLYGLHIESKKINVTRKG